MPLDTYANLKATIKRRSHRDDVDDNDLEDYIVQAESEFYNHSLTPIRVRDMEARATATASTSSRFLELPEDFLQMRSLHIVTSGGNQDIVYMAPEQLSVPGSSGRPRYFTVTTQLEFDVIPDSAYTIEMQYVKKITALSDTDPTNAILNNAPNIYLFGALWALFQDKMEMDLAEYWYGKFSTSLAGYNKTDKRGRYGPAPKIRIEGATP